MFTSFGKVRIRFQVFLVAISSTSNRVFSCIVLLSTSFSFTISAEIVNENEVDSKTIQLNTLFEVEDIATKKTWNLILTLPNEVNIKECKVSVFSPFGVALIGFSEGMIIECKLPSGSKKLKILKVNTK